MCSIGNNSGGGGDVYPGGGPNDHYHDGGVNREEDRNCTEIMVGSEGGTLQYVPPWDDVHSNVRWVFLLHHYGFACLFFFLAFYAFFSILNLRSQLSTRSYMSTINSFLCLLGVSRALNLLLSQAHIKLPVLIGALLNDLGFPCLISSFSLIQIAFLQLTQVTEEVNIKFRKKTFLSISLTVHFVTVFVSAIYTSFNADLMQVKLATQLVFALWGLILCGSFLFQSVHAGKQVLGILGHPGGHSTDGSLTSGNDKGNMKGLAAMGMGLLAPGQNIAASLTAALAPTLLHATPKIKITDENDRTVSVTSDLSRLNDNVDGGNNSTTSGSSNRPVTPVPGSSKSILNNSSGETAGDNSNSSNYVRPPSPVLPRRKSGGQSRAIVCGAGGASLANPQTRRQSLNRRGSGYVDEKDANRKKSLTWSESEVKEGAAGGKGGKGGKQKNLGDNNATGELGGSRRQSRKSMDNNADGSFGGSDKNGGAESLLLSGGGGGGPDLTLQSILSHIAYVNQTALDYRLSRKLSRKNQVQKVIKFTSITAMLGALLCIGEIIRILSPYGLLASTSPPHLWPWFAMQTISRTIEFAMGATVANITKQPGPTRQNLRFYY